MGDIQKKCGQLIRDQREKQGLLQRELAHSTGLQVRTIGRIERGEADVRIGTLEKIANALGVTIRDLV